MSQSALRGGSQSGRGGYPKCHKLPAEVFSLLRSEVEVSTLSRCVEELVYNAIDAGAKEIQAKINFSNFEITVQDNGRGMIPEDMEKIGTKYVTSKLKNMSELETTSRPLYGYRGEALASIIELSESVEIVSRFEGAGDAFTYQKKFCKGHVSELKQKPQKFDHGLIVAVKNFLSKNPVRQRRADYHMEREAVKSFIQAISLVHPDIGFTVRDGETSGLVCRCHRSNEPTQAFYNLSKEKASASFNFAVIPCTASVNGYEVHTLFATHGSKQKSIQYLFVNSRPVINSKILKSFSDILSKPLGLSTRDRSSGNSQGDGRQKSQPGAVLYPMFMVNFKCAISEYDLILQENKFRVEFQNSFTVNLVIKVTEAMLLDQVSKFMSGKPNSDLDDLSGKSEMDPGQVVKTIRDKASIRDHRGALNSQEALRNKCKTATSKAASRKPPSEKSYSSEEMQFDTMEPEIVKPRVSVLKPLLPQKSTRFVAKKSPFGKQSERTLDAAALRKRKKLRDSLDPNRADVKKTKIQDEKDKAEGINAWIEARKQATQMQAGPSDRYKSRQEKSSSPFQQSFVEELDPNESVISNLSHLSITPKPGNFVTSPQAEVNIVQDVRTAVYRIVTKEKIPLMKESLQKKLQGRLKSNPRALSMIHENMEQLNSARSSGSQGTSRTMYQASSIIQQDYYQSDCSSDPFLPPGSQGQAGATTAYWPMHKEDTEYRSSSQQSLHHVTNSNGPDFFGSQGSIVRQRDPEVRERYAAERQKRNAILLNSQECDMDSNFNLEGLTEEPHTSQRSSHRTSQSARRYSGSQNVHMLSQDRTYRMPEDSMGANVYNPYEPQPMTNDLMNNFDMGYDPMGRNVYNDLASGGPMNDTGNFFDAQEHLRDASSNLGSIGTPSNIEPSTYFVQSPQSEFPQNLKTNLEDENFFFESTSSPWTPASEVVLPEVGDNVVADDHTTAVVNVDEDYEKKKRFRNNWLRNVYPVNSSEYWKIEEPRTTSKEPWGDVTKIIGNSKSLLAATLTHYLSRIYQDDELTKWRYGLPTYDPANCPYEFDVPGAPGRAIRATKLTNGSKGTAPALQYHKCFRKEDLKLITFVGTMDKKFIIAKLVTAAVDENNISTTLVVFDQHAVHERIRLEGLQANVWDKSTVGTERPVFHSRDLLRNVVLKMETSILDSVLKFQQEYTRFGVHFVPHGPDSIEITRIPYCFDNRIKEVSYEEEGQLCETFIGPLVVEIAETMMATKGAEHTSFPKVILNELKSQACRGAIKFGDEVSAEKAQELLQKLQNCNMPFQCAHGRPTLYPLLGLKD